ncbi:hypothetical protein [Mesorhizobium sp. SP-1A]|uniref:hypothetical protein n=1 Tax=Mesorhizobium sp. SP-1A TaxID=3077840 RepID=UPI0028F725EF|nr:hypothetical protein [Mesorhizobium sp. SP-1A]
MKITEDHNKLVAEALREHKKLMSRFAKDEDILADRYGVEEVFRPQYETVGSFTALSFFNLLGPLSDLTKKAELEGQVVVGDTILKVSERPERKNIYNSGERELFSLDIYPADGHESVPAYQITYMIEGPSDNITEYNAHIYRIDPEKPNDEYPERIAFGALFEDRKKGKENIRMSYRPDGRFDCFSEFVSVMDMLRPALDGYQLRSDAEIGWRHTNSGVPLVLKEDGGLAGPLAVHTIEIARNELLSKLLPWLAEKADRVHSALNERGMVWNEKMLTYNNWNQQVFTVPTSNPLQQAHYHENISLVTDFSAHIILTDKDETGKTIGVEVYPIHRYKDFLPDVIEAIRNGTFDREPSIKFDVGTNTLVRFSDACPDLLHMAMLYSYDDIGMIDDQRIDDPQFHDDDFSRYFERDEEEDWDEDLEEENAPTAPSM